MDLKASGTTFTAQSLKARFLGKDQEHTSMAELIAYHNDKLEPILHYDTMRHIKTSQSYIMEFIQKE